MNDGIKDLLLSKKPCTFLVNDKYECTIDNPCAFSVFTKEDSCPMYKSVEKVRIFGQDVKASILIQWSLDLSSSLSAMLFFYEDNDGTDIVTSLTNISSIKFL